MKTKLLFLIHDLSVGGAEKVLVNLVNNMDQTKFDITVLALFGGGVNEQFLSTDIRCRAVFPRTIPGNSRLMKLFTPRQLHRWFIREHYDIEVSYLEGPCARVISGCPSEDTRLVSWIHVEQHTPGCAAGSFRSYEEAKRCYGRFHQTVCVSDYVRRDFLALFPEVRRAQVLYNTNETAQILEKATEPVEDSLFSDEEIKLVAVGKLSKIKGFDRLARILKRLRDDGFPVHMYALGVGELQDELRIWLRKNGLSDSYTFLGYQTNPYKYVARCDLFVCASFAEGFSTAATEALIVGTPVCTVEVSGMKEMLGEHNEYGVVCENTEDALYEAVRGLLADPARLKHYKDRAKERGGDFSTEETVKAVERMLEDFF